MQVVTAESALLLQVRLPASPRLAREGLEQGQATPPSFAIGISMMALFEMEDVQLG